MTPVVAVFVLFQARRNGSDVSGHTLVPRGGGSAVVRLFTKGGEEIVLLLHGGEGRRALLQAYITSYRLTINMTAGPCW